MNWKKYKILLLLFILSSSSLTGTLNQTIKDDLGYSFELHNPPQRIISMAPNITEILFALGLREKVVGVTRYCDFPQEARQKEKIGGMIDPSLEKIKSLNPDLIIGFRGNPLQTIKHMKSLDMPVFVCEMGTTLESVISLIKKIGIVTQREDAALSLAQSFEQKLAKIQSVLQDVKHKPRVFFILHGPGLWTGGKESLFDALVQKAKGVNIAGDIQRKWLLFNREQLVHENPDIIIIVSKSKREFLQIKKGILKEIYFHSIKAVRMDNIYFLEENLATRAGPRLIDALERLARILHPEQFQTPA